MGRDYRASNRTETTMRTYFYKLLSLAFFVLLAGFGFVLFELRSQQLADPSLRPIPKWQPQVQLVTPYYKATNETASYTATFSRPLFLHTRRPFVLVLPAPMTDNAPVPEPPPLSEPPPQATYDPNQFSLKGILITSSKESALVASPEQPSGRWFTVGTDLMGWKVLKIDNNSVTLGFGEQTHKLKQYVDKPPE